MGRNVRSTLSESFKYQEDMKTLNGFNSEKKTRAQQDRGTSLPRTLRLKESLRLILGMSEADRLDR